MWPHARESPHMIGSTEACHESLRSVTLSSYCWGVGERAVASFVGFAATSLYSNRKEHYDELVYESELCRRPR